MYIILISNGTQWCFTLSSSETKSSISGSDTPFFDAVRYESAWLT